MFLGLGRCSELLKISPDMGSLCEGTRWLGRSGWLGRDEILVHLMALHLQAEMRGVRLEVGDLNPGFPEMFFREGGKKGISLVYFMVCRFLV